MDDYKHGERTHRDEPEADMEELAKHIDAPQHTTVEKTAKAPHDSTRQTMEQMADVSKSSPSKAINIIRLSKLSAYLFQ